MRIVFLLLSLLNFLVLNFYSLNNCTSIFMQNICFYTSLVFYIHDFSELAENDKRNTTENVNPITRRARRHPGNRAMLARGSHLQETFALQVAQRRERAQEEQHKAERSVAGRVRQVLLSEDRSRQSEYLCIAVVHKFPFVHESFPS